MCATISTMAKQRRRRADMERHLARREAEGLTFVELAQRTGIPFGTLSSWNHKLRREAADGDGAAFVELVEAQEPDSPTPCATTRRDSSVRIEHPSGKVIEITGAAVEAAVEQLLREVTTWS